VAYDALPLDILPGLFKEASDYAAQGRYVDGNNVRFWKGFPERIGGWTSLLSSQLINPARGVTAWRSLSGAQYIAWGHARGVELMQGGALTDISPVGTNGYATLSILLSGVSGSYTAGETVTAAGGGTALVVSFSSPRVLVSADTGTFTGVLTGGSSGATGTIVSTEEANNIDSGATFGWGETPWGNSVWGGAESLYSTVDQATTWTFALWGEDLVASPRDGKIYILDTSAWEADNTTNMGLISSNAPSSALGVFMNDDNRTLVVYGAGGDPLGIDWSDQEDYTTWIAAADNTAGSIRCENGSTIIGRMACRDGHLIATDTTIYLFRYIGLPYVFELDKLTSGPSMISPHAGALQDNVTYWMGPDSFYQYDGSVLPLPCDVHADVFGRIDKIQAFKVFCGTIRKFNEVIWFYASQEGGGEVDSCVAYNTVERTWWQGDVARTSWLDTSVTLAYPVAADADGNVYAQEFGTTANGEAFSYRLETGDIEVNDGGTFLHNRKILTDFDRILGSSHELTIEVRDYPNRAPRVKGPYAISTTTEQISVRARGRTLRYLLEGSDDFRMGRWRSRVTGHGSKP
jgi:hypothetical protein